MVRQEYRAKGANREKLASKDLRVEMGLAVRKVRLDRKGKKKAHASSTTTIANTYSLLAPAF